MEELSKTPHLYIRSGKFYFRIRVPKELVSYLGKKEIKRSLKTSSRFDAKIQASLEKVKADELFATARRALYSIEKTASPPSVSEAELERAALIWFKHEKGRLEKLDLENSLTLNPQQQADFIDSLIDELTALESTEESVYSHILQPVSKRILANHNISLQNNKIQSNYFNLLIHRGSVQLTRDQLANYGYSNSAPKDNFFTTSLTEITEPYTEITICTWGEVIKSFFEAKSSDGLSKKTIAAYKLISDFSIEFFGRNRDICSISTNDCRNLRDNISHLPSNAKKHHPTLSLIESSKLYSQDNTSCLSSTSINNQIRNLSTIFNFALDEGLITRNPASTIKRVKTKKTDGPSRRPFKISELNNIFQAPLYTGCIDDRRNFNKVGDNHPRGARFWIPLISLFTGMRLTECCQLFSEDINELDGVPVIYVREDDSGQKKLKNATSERIIPIHPVLEKIGLIKFANKAQANSQRLLFSELHPNSSGSYSDNTSKWFGRFIDLLNLKHSGLVFHSFRHTFRDATRNNDLNQEAIASIGGWTYSNDVMDKYGDGYQILRLYEEIKKIEYEGLYLKHLFLTDKKLIT